MKPLDTILLEALYLLPNFLNISFEYGFVLFILITPIKCNIILHFHELANSTTTIININSIIFKFLNCLFFHCFTRFFHFIKSSKIFFYFNIYWNSKLVNLALHFVFIVEYIVKGKNGADVIVLI